MQPRKCDRLSADLINPLYLYQREIQAIPRLSKEDELTLHQAIESYLKEVLWICTAVPESLEVIHTHFAKITAGELRVETLLHGFASIDPHHPKPGLPEVQERLFKLLILQYSTQAKLNNLGDKNPETKASRKLLLEGLIGFKWTAQVIDELAEYFQSLEPKRSALKKKFHQALTAFKQAKQALIAGNLRLVFFVARKYSHVGVLFLDLIQEGNMGLIQAIDRFDYHWGYAFSTYASIWIKRAILNALSKFQSIPVQKDEVLKIEDQETPTPMEVALASDLCKTTEQALSRLPPREADILRLRFGIGHPNAYTLDEVGEVFKLSRERIRQIEARALNALRDQVEAPSLKIFLNKH